LKTVVLPAFGLPTSANSGSAAEEERALVQRRTFEDEAASWFRVATRDPRKLISIGSPRGARRTTVTSRAGHEAHLAQTGQGRASRRDKGHEAALAFRANRIEQGRLA